VPVHALPIRQPALKYQPPFLVRLRLCQSLTCRLFRHQAASFFRPRRHFTFRQPHLLSPRLSRSRTHQFCPSARIPVHIRTLVSFLPPTRATHQTRFMTLPPAPAICRPILTSLPLYILSPLPEVPAPPVFPSSPSSVTGPAKLRFDNDWLPYPQMIGYTFNSLKILSLVLVPLPLFLIVCTLLAVQP
jgi:hypothetical protein